MLRVKHLSWTAASIALVLASSTTFLSCSKESEQIEETAQLEGTKLVLNVSGIDEGRGISAKGASASADVSKQNTAKIVEFPEFDAVLAIDDNVPLKASQRVVKAAKSGSSAGVRAAAVENGVKYRLYLFSQDGTQLISSTLFTSGTQGTLDVKQGTTYKWVALSYNTGEEVADISTTNTKINLPAGKDILYATGVTSIPTGGTTVNVPINIAFKHKFARLGVELNSEGMFANMTGAKVAVAGLKTATIDVATGGLSDLITADQEIPFATFVDIDPAYQDAKIAYAYTADPTRVIGGIKVSVSNLALRIDNNTIRQFSSTPVDFAFNVTPTLGNSQRLLVNLIESPLTIDGVRWARQNLYYQAGHNPYRFHHTYAHSNARNTYFSFGGVEPTKFGTYKDACSLVYPQGVWRQASENDFRKLTGVLGIGGKQVTYGKVGNKGYFEYDATGTTAPYPSNKLRFNFNGGSYNINFLDIQIIPAFSLQNDGTRAEVWTGTAGLDFGGLAGYGAWYYHGDNGLLTGNTDDLTASLLNFATASGNFAQSQMKNIRCVRK